MPDPRRDDLARDHDYHRELSPVFLRLMAQSRSLPFRSARPLRYLELGCGAGVSLNIHAAAAPGAYWGTDVRADSLQQGQALAVASGADVKLLNASLADLLQRADLPRFDIIADHGLGPADRALIVALLVRYLANGGFYLQPFGSAPALVEAGLATVTRAQRFEMFVKSGGSRLQARIANDQSFVLVQPPAAAMAFGQGAGKAIVERLAADDYRPKRLDELGERTALFALIEAGFVHPVQSREAIVEAAPRCARLNAEILRRSRGEDRIEVLASPLTGSGVQFWRGKLPLYRALGLL